MRRAIRGLMWVMLTTALVVMVPRAFAQRPPETHPVSEHRDIVMSWDRSAMPGDVELWAPRTVVGYDHQNPSLRYGGLHFVCKSNSSAASGKCPTSGTSESSANAGGIPLTFIEKRSGMRVDIPVIASVERAYGSRVCRSDYWQGSVLFPWSSFEGTCSLEAPVGTGAQLKIQGADLEKLVAGNWTAALELKVDSPVSKSLATYSASFQLSITDHTAASIYFPQYESATPLINLDARFDPIRQTIGGRVVVDMCLYDGLGSQASFLGVTARHASARAPGPTGFALWHETPGTADSQRLDYTVTLNHSGAAVPLINGVETELHGIDSARLRLVLLPGMNQPVFCVPTPMTLDIPRVPVSEKQSGVYWGDLKLELRVPTASP